MKKLILVILLSGFALMVQAQSKSVELLYNKYKNNKDFFHMDLAGSFLNFAEGMNLKLEEANLETITRSVERVKMFKLPVSGDVAKTDFKALQRGLEKERFELMMELTEKSSGLSIYSRGGNKIKEIVLLIAGEGNDDHMVIALEGEFDAQAIAQATDKAKL